MSWPSFLTFVSPLACSARQSTSTPSMPEHASPRELPYVLVCLVNDVWSRRYLDLGYNLLTSNGLLNVTWPEHLEYVERELPYMLVCLVNDTSAHPHNLPNDRVPNL